MLYPKPAHNHGFFLSTDDLGLGSNIDFPLLIEQVRFSFQLAIFVIPESRGPDFVQA